MDERTYRRISLRNFIIIDITESQIEAYRTKVLPKRVNACSFENFIIGSLRLGDIDISTAFGEEEIDRRSNLCYPLRPRELLR